MFARDARDGGKWWGLVEAEVTILCIDGETLETRGGVRQGGGRYDGERALAFAFAFVFVFVDHAHDSGQDTRVPPAACIPKS